MKKLFIVVVSGLLLCSCTAKQTASKNKQKGEWVESRMDGYIAISRG